MNRFISLLFLLVFYACQKEQIPNVIEDPNIKEYLFLGHIYEKDNRVDQRVEALDLKSFDGIWLGGDLCVETTASYSTLQYLDCVFDLDNASTHWAVGNHDIRNGNVEWISEFTKRPTYYTHHMNGLQIVVLNTCLGRNEPLKDRCEEMEEQYHMLDQMLDTVREASHLVLLSHHNVWGGIDQHIHCEAANACALWNNFRCHQSSKFSPYFYEKLVEVRRRGIEVLAVAGDGGQKSKRYTYRSEEGIHFLVSGIAKNSTFNPNPDSVLLFQHHLKTQELQWSFVRLDDLLKTRSTIEDTNCR